MTARTGTPGFRLDRRVQWARVSPYLAIQAGCLAVIWVGFSWVAAAVCVGLYLARMFAITAFYHRYFSHRAFRTSRVVQGLFAVLGNMSVQRSPLWWAAHHREHHANTESERDLHSPRHGLLWSHMWWFTTRQAFGTDLERVSDFARYPELRFLDRYDWIAPLALAAGLFALGAGLEAWAPGLGTSGWQMLVWGFCVSTTLLYHATFTINSLAHVWGSRRYETRDTSRNNRFLALLTLGEGWHNNHHRYPHAVRQGFFRGEFDPTHSALRLMERLGLVWGLRPVPARVLDEGRARGAS
ncbi:MAG: acyl-CoA desaturase [Planctomycetota bacterium]